MRIFRALCNAIFQEVDVKVACESISFGDDSKLSKKNAGNGETKRVNKGVFHCVQDNDEKQRQQWRWIGTIRTAMVVYECW